MSLCCHSNPSTLRHFQRMLSALPKSPVEMGPISEHFRASMVKHCETGRLGYLSCCRRTSPLTTMWGYGGHSVYRVVFGCCPMPLEGWARAASSRYTLRRTVADLQCFCKVVRCVNTSPAPVSLWNLTLLLFLPTTTEQKLHGFDAENWKLMRFSTAFVHAWFLQPSSILPALTYIFMIVHMTSHLLEKAQATFTALGCSFQCRCHGSLQ